MVESTIAGGGAKLRTSFWRLCLWIFGFYGWTLIDKALKEKQQVFSKYISSKQQVPNEGLERDLQTNDPSQKKASLETLYELMAKIAICR